MNKATTCNRAVPLIWEEDDALRGIAKARGVSFGEIMRQGLYLVIGQTDPKTVEKLQEIRRQKVKQVAGWTCSLIVGFIFVQGAITGHQSEMRVSRTAVRPVRVLRGREMEG